MAKEKKGEEDYDVVKIGTGGRIVISSEYLKRKGLNKGDVALCTLIPGNVVPRGDEKKEGTE